MLIVDIPLPRLVADVVLWGMAAPLYGKKVIARVNHYSGDLL